MPQTSLAITWTLTTLSGYGIYGLEIAQQFLRRGGEKFIPTAAPVFVQLPHLTQTRLRPILELGQKIDALLKNNPSETFAFDHPVLHAVGNNCAGSLGQERITGSPNVGCAAIEHPAFNKEALSYAKRYDCFLAISRWNEAFLRSLDIAPVHLCHQGIDPGLFHPAPASDLWKDRFLVFSGGKFEFRKGQDIVLEAFRRFQAKHPEALLIASWQNIHEQDPAPFARAGYCQTTPKKMPEGQGLLLEPWIIEQGLPIGSFIALPYLSNMLMPSILRECDVAVFPNRCEGGTNLVAMEAAACGVPTFVSDNTGQKDLIELLDFQALTCAKEIKPCGDMLCTEGWQETDADEVLRALEIAYTQKEEQKERALKQAAKVQSWSWAAQNEKLLQKIM